MPEWGGTVVEWLARSQQEGSIPGRRQSKGFWVVFVPSHSRVVKVKD